MIKIENLSKKYSDRVVLDNVNLSIYPGEIVGLLGDNGSGKTTLIKCMMNLLKYQGKIFIDDKVLQKNNRVEDVSFLLEPFFFNELSAKKNLMFIKGYLRESNNIDAILKNVNLFENKDKKVKSFSYGMKQRLGLAQALVNKKNKYIILDEPTVGIDPIGIDILKKNIKNMSSNHGIGILITSHELSFINEVCDRVLFLRKGKIKNIDDFKDEKNSYYIEIESNTSLDEDVYLRNFINSKNTLKVSEKKLNEVISYVVRNSLIIKKIKFEDYLQTLFKDDAQ